MASEQRDVQDAVVAAAAASGFLDTIMVKTKDENGEVINEEWKRVAGPGGLDGYLRWAAINQPAEFIRLLGRILPLQVKTESTNPTVTVYKTVEEAEEAFRERGLPVPQLFSD